MAIHIPGNSNYSLQNRLSRGQNATTQECHQAFLVYLDEHLNSAYNSDTQRVPRIFLDISHAIQEYYFQSQGTSKQASLETLARLYFDILSSEQKLKNDVGLVQYLVQKESSEFVSNCAINLSVARSFLDSFFLVKAYSSDNDNESPAHEFYKFIDNKSTFKASVRTTSEGLPLFEIQQEKCSFDITFQDRMTELNNFDVLKSIIDITKQYKNVADGERVQVFDNVSKEFDSRLRVVPQENSDDSPVETNPDDSLVKADTELVKKQGGNATYSLKQRLVAGGVAYLGVDLIFDAPALAGNLQGSSSSLPKNIPAGSPEFQGKVMPTEVGVAMILPGMFAFVKMLSDSGMGYRYKLQQQLLTLVFRISMQHKDENGNEVNKIEFKKLSSDTRQEIKSLLLDGDKTGFPPFSIDDFYSASKLFDSQPVSETKPITSKDIEMCVPKAMSFYKNKLNVLKKTNTSLTAVEKVNHIKDCFVQALGLGANNNLPENFLYLLMSTTFKFSNRSWFSKRRFWGTGLDHVFMSVDLETQKEIVKQLKATVYSENPQQAQVFLQPLTNKNGQKVTVTNRFTGKEIHEAIAMMHKTIAETPWRDRHHGAEVSSFLMFDILTSEFNSDEQKLLLTMLSHSLGQKEWGSFFKGRVSRFSPGIMKAISFLYVVAAIVTLCLLPIPSVSLLCLVGIGVLTGAIGATTFGIVGLYCWWGASASHKSKVKMVQAGFNVVDEANNYPVYTFESSPKQANTEQANINDSPNDKQIVHYLNELHKNLDDLKYDSEPSTFRNGIASIKNNLLKFKQWGILDYILELSHGSKDPIILQITQIFEKRIERKEFQKDANKLRDSLDDLLVSLFDTSNEALNVGYVEKTKTEFANKNMTCPDEFFGEEKFRLFWSCGLRELGGDPTDSFVNPRDIFIFSLRCRAWIKQVSNTDKKLEEKLKKEFERVLVTAEKDKGSPLFYLQRRNPTTYHCLRTGMRFLANMIFGGLVSFSAPGVASELPGALSNLAYISSSSQLYNGWAIPMTGLDFLSRKLAERLEYSSKAKYYHCLRTIYDSGACTGEQKKTKKMLKSLGKYDKKTAIQGTENDKFKLTESFKTELNYNLETVGKDNGTNYFKEDFNFVSECTKPLQTTVQVNLAVHEGVCKLLRERFELIKLSSLADKEQIRIAYMRILSLIISASQQGLNKVLVYNLLMEISQEFCGQGKYSKILRINSTGGYSRYLLPDFALGALLALPGFVESFSPNTFAISPSDSAAVGTGKFMADASLRLSAGTMSFAFWAVTVDIAPESRTGSWRACQSVMKIVMSLLAPTENDYTQYQELLKKNRESLNSQRNAQVAPAPLDSNPVELPALSASNSVDSPAPENQNVKVEVEDTKKTHDYWKQQFYSIHTSSSKIWTFWDLRDTKSKKLWDECIKEQKKQEEHPTVASAG